jgi:hypothetical protein
LEVTAVFCGHGRWFILEVFLGFSIWRLKRHNLLFALVAAFKAAHEGLAKQTARFAQLRCLSLAKFSTCRLSYHCGGWVKTLEPCMGGNLFLVRSERNFAQTKLANAFT